MKLNITRREGTDIVFKYAPLDYTGDWSDRHETVVDVAGLMIENPNDIEQVKASLSFMARDWWEREQANINANTTVLDGIDALVAEDETVVTDAAMYEQLEPWRQGQLAADMDYIDARETYPPVPDSALDAMRAIKYKHFEVKLVRRESDGLVVGFEAGNLFGTGPGPLLELNKFHDDLMALGVGSFQVLMGDENLTKDEFSQYLQNTFGYTQIIGPNTNYAYHPIDVNVWATRQKRIIEEERDAAIYADFTYEGNPYKSAQRDIDLLKGELTKLATGRPLTPAWRDANNVMHPNSEAFITGINTALDTKVEAAYVTSWTRKATVDGFVAGPGTDAEKIAAIQNV